MLGLLADIWNAIRSLPYLIIDFLVMVLNALIVAIGAFASLVLGLLPSFPAGPGAPTGGVLGFLNWIAPLGPMIATFAVLVTAWTTFLLVKVALKWVKAL
jgi:hypothetical protein